MFDGFRRRYAKSRGKRRRLKFAVYLMSRIGVSYVKFGGWAAIALHGRYGRKGSAFSATGGENRRVKSNVCLEVDTEAMAPSSASQ